MLSFDEQQHKYFWDGKEVPGVSAILKETGQAKDWSAVDPFYRDRGSAVHKAVSLFLKDQLDEGSLDPVILPYFNQFKDWVKSQPMMGGLLLTENPIYSKKMNYAGTLDLVANQVIWDLKCSKRMDKATVWQYDCQGAGYKTLFREQWGFDFPFKILLLTGEGPAQSIPLQSKYETWEKVKGLYDEKTRGTL